MLGVNCLFRRKGGSDKSEALRMKRGSGLLQFIFYLLQLQ
jgi:hypothetical protein